MKLLLPLRSPCRNRRKPYHFLHPHFYWSTSSPNESPDCLSSTTSYSLQAQHLPSSFALSPATYTSSFSCLLLYHCYSTALYFSLHTLVHVPHLVPWRSNLTTYHHYFITFQLHSITPILSWNLSRSSTSFSSSPSYHTLTPLSLSKLPTYGPVVLPVWHPHHTTEWLALGWATRHQNQCQWSTMPSLASFCSVKLCNLCQQREIEVKLWWG